MPVHLQWKCKWLMSTDQCDVGIANRSNSTIMKVHSELMPIISLQAGDLLLFIDAPNSLADGACTD